MLEGFCLLTLICFIWLVPPLCQILRSKSQCNEWQLEDFLLKTFAEKTWLHPFPYYLFISSQFPHFLRKDLVVSCFGFQGTQPAKDCLIWKKVRYFYVTSHKRHKETKVQDRHKNENNVFHLRRAMDRGLRKQLKQMSLDQAVVCFARCMGEPCSLSTLSTWSSSS